VTIFSHPPTLVFCFLLPLFFPRFFAANKIFFSSFSRSSCFDQNDRPLENGRVGEKKKGKNNEKEKKPKNTQQQQQQREREKKKTKK